MEAHLEVRGGNPTGWRAVWQWLMSKWRLRVSDDELTEEEEAMERFAMEDHDEPPVVLWLEVEPSEEEWEEHYGS
jgi:hypothetical protein